MKHLLFLLTISITLLAARIVPAQTIVCNSETYVSLDANCAATLLPDDVLEQPCACPQGALLQVDKVPPYGNGPWVAPNFGPADVGGTYQARVTAIGTGLSCWGFVFIEDKVPPVLDCAALTVVTIAPGGSATLPVSALQITADDACSGPAAVTVDNGQTSVFYTCSDRGLRQLTVTATDNEGNTATCQASVLVSDPDNHCQTGCVVDCPQPVVTDFETGIFSLLPAWQAGDLSGFDLLGTPGFDPGCTPSDTVYTVTYQAAPNGYAAFVRNWEIQLGGTPFGDCQQWIIFPATQTLTFSGTVFLDSLSNCAPDAGETGIDLFPVTVTRLPGQEQVSVVPAPDGTYTLEVEVSALDTAVELRIALPPGLVTACPSVLAVSAPSLQTQFLHDFGLYGEGPCALPTVSVGTPFLRRCFSNPYHINYGNLGYSLLTDAYLTLELPPLMTLDSASLPYTSDGNVHTFDLGDVPPFTVYQFSAHIGVSCDAELGQTLCVEAVVRPHEPCNAPAWTGPVVETAAYCDGDSVRLVVRNTGSAAMADDRTFIVVEDIIMRQSGTFNLGPGDSTALAFAANGATWRIEAGQVDGYPVPDQPASVVEACGGLNTPGLVNSFPLNDEALFRDIDCEMVIASFDPNDKTARPTGYGPQHMIRANADLEYKIRFQNTGTDTAFTVVIVDTLSALLDPARFQAGTASHPYRLDVAEFGILRFVFENILLPDSNVNEAASHGFVTFRIPQQPDLPFGSVIENRAAIYFDFNAPVITNTAFHTIGEPYGQMSVSVDPPVRPGLAIQVRPNPFDEQAILTVDGHRFRAGLLRLYDAHGRTVQTRVLSGNACTVLRGELRPGMYFFQVTDAGVLVGSGKMEVR